MLERSEVAEVLSAVDALLFDFDGPICEVFAGYPAPLVAKDLCGQLAAEGMTIPDDARTEPDPLQAWRLVAMLDSTISAHAESILTELEIRATAGATPTAYASNAIQEARKTGRALGIVSNNSKHAIVRYLCDPQPRSRF